MKKIIPFFTAMLMSASALAEPIDQTRAFGIAQEFMKPGHAMTLVSTATRTPAKAQRLDGAVASTSPYYIYSRGVGQGFVIVSGDDCIPEIIGYTDQGDFDTDNMPPALKDMLDYYALAVETAQETGTNATAPKKAMNKAAANRDNILPFTTSHWHQSGPYNDICPCRVDNGQRAMTGCVATAASQILYYWRKDLPATLQSTTPTYGYGNAHPEVSFPKGTPVKWDLMRDSYSGSEPKEYKESVAEFVYCVGTATWLTYADGSGTATSGNIENIPATFSGFFGMNGGRVEYRSSYSQEAWTQLIYEELAKGRPVMYTGVHPTNGGHAVYIDGYQKSTDLMHFNFGWGGQGDGYYTTATTDGMNGFNDYQSALIGAYPMKQNVKGDVRATDKVLVNVDNNFRITVENNSTLAINGLYLFLAANTTSPTDLSKAKSADADVVIESGSKKSITLSGKPTSARTWYVTVTDANLSVLATKTVEVENSQPELIAKSLTVLGTSDTEDIAGHSYTKVYNNGTAALKLVMENAVSEDYGGTAKIDLYESVDGGETFSLLKTVTKSNTVISGNGLQTEVILSASSLNADNLYYVVPSEEWGSGASKVSVKNESEPVYFKIVGATDLAAVLDGKVLKFSGHWDSSQFSTIVSKPSNKNAVMYDLTEVTGVTEVAGATFPNHNSLVYAAKGASGKNVISDGVCSFLELTAGYDFTPIAGFKADKASLDINMVPNAWSMLTVPFSCDIPSGFIAREVNSHRQSVSGINNTSSTELASNVSRLEAGKSYLVMFSTANKQVLHSDDPVDVLAQPVENKDAAFIGTFTSITTPEGAKVVMDDAVDKQYFKYVGEGTVVDAFRGYFYDEVMLTDKTDFRAFSNSSADPQYLTLGRTIETLYDVYEECKGYVTPEANAIMLDSIASAEHIYTAQPLPTSSTTETTIKKYYEALSAYADQYRLAIGAVGDNEIDMTTLLVNPSFESSALKPTGWTVEGTGYMRKNSDLNNKTVNGDGAVYFSGAAGTKVQQTIAGVLPGVYRVTAKVGAATEDDIINVFANDQKATANGNSFGKHYLTEIVIDDVKVEQGGELTIGAESANVYFIDDFTLTYVANLDEDTAITDVCTNNSSVKEGIYTLQGVKLPRINTPGIYIINGKKTVVK